MRLPVIVPDLGSGTPTARLGGWLVAEGDAVIAGDVVAELLLSGIVFDVSVEYSGQLVEIAQKTDARVQTGTILGWIETENDRNADAAATE